MPHFVVEYSDPMTPPPDVQGMMQAICAAAAATGIVARGDLKLRSVPYDDFLMGDGSGSFVHLTISLLEGRSGAQKEELTLACRAALVEACPQADAISVDIRDMESRAYKKRVKPRESPV